MNYNEAIRLREKYLYLLDTHLLKNAASVITDIVVLPLDELTLSLYVTHITRFKSDWMATGFNNDFIHRQSGISTLINNKQFCEDLVLYALVKHQKNNVNIEYKAVQLNNLIRDEEIIKVAETRPPFHLVSLNN